ncbi:MAG: hypothetical protein K9G48_13790 [Reyranella sp.]|nr:hypothetical protein [Reyranella sp.]
MSRMDFGLTNDVTRLEAARAYVAAAVADGWGIEPSYSSEPIESAAKLRREGFQMSVLMRVQDPARSTRYQVSISVWGPDGLVIRPPDAYDWVKIKGGLRRCNNCNAEDVDTERYSFAGRCCAACLPKMRADHEKPGWTN